MGDGKSWVDLLDPTAEEIEAAAGVKLRRARAGAARRHGGEPRPRFFGAADHAVGAFVVPVAVKDEDRVYYQEVDLVLSRDQALTVRRTPKDGEPFDPTELKETCEGRDVPPGKVAFHLADIVAERYLDLIDDLNEEIDEVEDALDQGPRNGDVHQRISALRHDILHIRQTLSPTRDAVHRVVDGRVEGEAARLLDEHEVTLFSDVYDKLLRANDCARALTRSRRRRPRLLPVEGGAEPERGRAAADRDRLHPPLPHLRGRRLRAELRPPARSCTGTTATRSPGP